MKLALYAICAAAMVICGTGCTTEGGASARVGGPGAVVTVQYVSPETFTDFSIQGRSVVSSTTLFTQDVTRALVPVMRGRFPGNMLTLRFTDINLAGRRFAGRPGSARILRPNMSARLSFVYLLQDQSGRTLASGSQTLVNNLHRTLARNSSNSRPLYFETLILRRWLESLSVPLEVGHFEVGFQAAAQSVAKGLGGMTHRVNGGRPVCFSGSFS